jgi:glucan endo-1,3-alpha-glucosidase
VLSTWGGEGGSWNGPTTASVKTRWQSLVLAPLKTAGINTYFMPFFLMTDANGQYTGIDSGTVSAEAKNLLSGLADGFFYAPSITCPIDPAQADVFAGAEAYAAGLKSAGLGTMSSVTPQYWGSKQTSLGRRYIEYYGGEGLAAQWTSIINVQKPNWVECFTWNDFDEATYFSPIDDVNKYWPYTAHPAPGFYKSHAGALKLNQYFINWYKSGVKPAVTADSIYCFYRTNPKDAVATNDHVGRVNWFIGDCEDDIYITTILTAPATLVVTTGSKTVSLPVGAGLQNTRVPFQVGAQAFQIIRGGQTTVSQIGTPITAVPTEYNFNYYTVAASSH